MTIKAYALAAVVSVASSTAAAGSMEVWIEEVLPESYPELVQAIETNGPVTARWAAQSGDVITAVVTLMEGDLIISTTMPTASIIKDDWVDVEIATLTSMAILTGLSSIFQATRNS
jgi:hypothetical protein